MFFECQKEVFFFLKFFECSMLIQSFWRLQHSSKDAVLKIQLSASMKRKNLSLDKKMKVIDYANKSANVGCRVIAEHFSIGKTYVSDILLNAKALQTEYEFFKGNCKRLRHGHWINETLIAWYKKCARANVFPDGPMLKEEAILIKERLSKHELATFTASNGWLETLKQTYGLRETRITGEANDIPKMTIQSWIGHLPELTSGCELRNIWNMDELGLFFEALPEKSLVEKSRRRNGDKKSKQCLAVAFFAAVDGSKFQDPL